jgi:hypothetical protein
MNQRGAGGPALRWLDSVEVKLKITVIRNLERKLQDPIKWSAMAEEKVHGSYSARRRRRKRRRI